jgi:hypothetical protein
MALQKLVYRLMWSNTHRSNNLEESLRLIINRVIFPIVISFLTIFRLQSDEVLNKGKKYDLFATLEINQTELVAIILINVTFDDH